MTRLRFLLIACPLMTLGAACSETALVPIDTARSNQTALLFHNDPVQHGPVLDQVTALQASADALVRSSTLYGAAAGAALGCGLALVSESSARDCVTHAVAGGAAGAVVGRWAGARAVSGRMALVAEADVARDLRATQGQLAQIATDLPTRLAQQEQELTRLAMQLIRREISQEDHDLAVARIETERFNLAQALEMTAREVRQARENLATAAARGQTGLDWHIVTATDLERDVESTRLSIDLL